MVGKLVLPDGRAATLDDDFQWQSADAALLATLRTEFDPRPDLEPWAGIPGRLTIRKAAKALGAKVTLGEAPPEEPDVVY